MLVLHCAWLAAFVPPALAQPGSEPRAVLSPDGTVLATGHWDGTLKLIDATTGKELITLQKGIGRKKAEISAQPWLPTMSFSPDGTMLASHRANEPEVLVWDIPKGKQVAALEGSCDLLSFSSDGKLIAGHEGFGRVVIWDLATKKPRAAIDMKERVDMKAMNFSANGKLLVTTSAPNAGKVDVAVWETETGKKRLSASGVSAQVAAGGRTLIVLTREGGITFWDLNTGQKRAMFDLHTFGK
jgi:WD40 repeat protein